ncbi:hypothetical protein WDU94_000307 [Cyamophila willieti]
MTPKSSCLVSRLNKSDARTPTPFKNALAEIEKKVGTKMSQSPSRIAEDIADLIKKEQECDSMFDSSESPAASMSGNIDSPRLIHSSSSLSTLTINNNTQYNGGNTVQEEDSFDQVIKIIVPLATIGNPDRTIFKLDPRFWVVATGKSLDQQEMTESARSFLNELERSKSRVVRSLCL